MDTTFVSDSIDVELPSGEVVTVWNRVTVSQLHDVRFNEIETHHQILTGDGSTGERPEFVTPDILEQLRHVDVYPDVDVIDPTDEEVAVL